MKKNETAANGIICNGPYCDDLNIVSCSGIYFDIDYKCNTPDIESSDFDTSFTIRCYGNVYRNDNCYVQVDIRSNKQLNKVNGQSPSILKLTIYLILAQLLMFAFLAPAIYVATKK